MANKLKRPAALWGTKPFCVYVCVGVEAEGIPWRTSTMTDSSLGTPTRRMELQHNDRDHAEAEGKKMLEGCGNLRSRNDGTHLNPVPKIFGRQPNSFQFTLTVALFNQNLPQNLHFLFKKKELFWVNLFQYNAPAKKKSRKTMKRKRLYRHTSPPYPKQPLVQETSPIWIALFPPLSHHLDKKGGMERGIYINMICIHFRI